jgi:hypothetical protein
MGILCATLILGSVSFAIAGVPDLQLSVATGPASACVLYNLPNGNGAPFTDAVAVVGFADVDATIDLTLNDGLGLPINLFPFEDMWLESSDGGLVACTGGTTADASTDALGATQWQNPLAAGGSTSSTADLTVVMINGAALTSNAGLPIAHNSADINADGQVNLSDVQLFAADFYAVGYNFKSDLAFDAQVNLSDIVPLAQAMGGACP